MKRIFTLGFVLALCVSMSSFAQLAPQTLLTEDFTGAAGTLLTAAGWNQTGTSSATPIAITSPGLTFTGYSSSGIGNAALLGTSGQDVNHVLSDSVNSGSLYASLMVNVTSAQSTGDYFFHFSQNPTNTFAFVGRVFVKLAASTGKLSFGISKSSTNATAAPVYSDSIYSTGTTYLLVVKYTINPDTLDDVASLFINPNMGPNEPTSTLISTTTSSTSAEPVYFGAVGLRQGSASNAASVIVDGIKVARSWGGVVPVELTSFTANYNKSKVSLSWATATEKNNRGFEVQKKSNGAFETVAFIQGNGTTTDKHTYSYSDANVKNGSYTYRLKQVDFDGSFTYSKEVEVEVTQPKVFALNQNYPNPFNPSTTISFSLAADSKVSLKIFNILGQEITTLINSSYAAGTHEFKFNASMLNSGIYFYKLVANGIDGSAYSSVKKMMLAK